jgi:hypothetical protein
MLALVDQTHFALASPAKLSRDEHGKALAMPARSVGPSKLIAT